MKFDNKADAKAGDAKTDAAKPRGKQIPPPADVAAPPADATKTASGLAYKQLAAGTGDASPKQNDTVKINSTGWTTDGVTFETTDGAKPKTVQVAKAIPGWTEMFQLMRLGEKVRVWVPEELAYKGMKGRPAGTLVFDLELVELLAAPETPPDVAAPPADAKKTKSGLAYKVLAAGTGKDHPNSWDKATVNYSGWTTDGKMFDSSVTRGKPASFNLKQVVPGWTEGIPLMVKGEKTRFWIPKELAYDGKPGKPQGMLVFDVELVDFEKLPEPPPPPETPKDVAAAPKDAQTTPSGLAYKVIKKGTGKDRPKAESKVTVHYSGWTTDGKMFDSSITRNRPASFPLGNVIKGWTEGLQLMTVGEKTRFWIP
ncbi:MAG: FKBP-type peptidyl-prolyl cis-trans isomerase, partial [Deltaproteobacteria bacterium]|nr:FKBP-type peptidyl-prolyl cis-trans isomerase [Nannocystaceae bacterium]